MSLQTRLVGKIAYLASQPKYNYKLWLYLQQKKENPIEFLLPEDIKISLYPQGQIAELLYTSKFEMTELSLVISYLKSGMNVIDIGANIGLYSIVADKIIGSNGKVLAFEPSSQTHERLLANLSLNNTVAVEVAKIALSDIVDEVLTLQRDPGYKDGDRYLSTRKNENFKVSANQDDLGDKETVKVTTLDHYIYGEKTNTPQIDFIKIDIEGGEYSVFRGAKKVLTDNPNIVLMFECTPQGCRCAGHTQEDVFGFLQELGFGLYCWNSKRRVWESDLELLKSAGNVWACRDEKQLPIP